MTVNPTVGVTPIRVGDRVQLQSAATVTQSIGHGLILQGAALPAALATHGHALSRIDMTDDEVALQIAKALDATLQRRQRHQRRSHLCGQRNVSHDYLTSSKVDGRTIRLYGHNVISAGPLPYSNTLSGDQNGKFYSQMVTDGGVNLFRDIDGSRPPRPKQ